MVGQSDIQKYRFHVGIYVGDKHKKWRSIETGGASSRTAVLNMINEWYEDTKRVSSRPLPRYSAEVYDRKTGNIENYPDISALGNDSYLKENLMKKSPFGVYKI